MQKIKLGVNCNKILGAKCNMLLPTPLKKVCSVLKYYLFLE